MRRYTYNSTAHERSHKPRRRITVRPRFFLILTVFFVLLSVAFFSLADAQTHRMVGNKHIESSDGNTVTPIVNATPDTDSGDGSAAGPDQTTEKNPVEDDIPSAITENTLENAACYIMLDPGHGGQDGGCVHGTLKESNLDLDLALLIRTELQDKGIGVLMTREDDTLPSGKQLSGLYTRATMCNKSNAVCFVSIHANSFSDSSVHGMDCYFNGVTNSKSESFAQLVLDSASAATSAKNRGLFSDSELVVTREVKVPSCLLEVGFLTNPDEFANLTNDTYKQKLAKGITNGIIDFLIQEGYVKEVTE